MREPDECPNCHFGQEQSIQKRTRGHVQTAVAVHGRKELSKRTGKEEGEDINDTNLDNR